VKALLEDAETGTSAAGFLGTVVLGLWMRIRLLVLRWLALVTMSVWLGGFTFHSSVVIPVLDRLIGRVETGFITREVTNYLNGIGVGTVLVWWLLVAAESSSGTTRQRRLRAGALAISTAILFGLVVLHRIMDARLDGGSLRGFYLLHRVYLIASAVQWVANLALLAATTAIWQDTKSTAGGR
jgi:hypothetical protein